MKVLILLLFPLQIFAQDITGIWTGRLYNDTTQKYLPYEVTISEYKGKLSGYSQTIFLIDGKEETGVKSLKIKKKNDKFFIEDDDLIYNNYSAPPPKGVRQYSELSFSLSDSGMILSGLFSTNRTREYRPLTGTVYLQKKNNNDQTKLIQRLKKLGLEESLSFIQSPDKKEIAVVAPIKKEPAPEANKKEDKKDTLIVASTQKTENKKPIIQPKIKEVEKIPPPVVVKKIEEKKVVAVKKEEKKQQPVTSPKAKQSIVTPATQAAPKNNNASLIISEDEIKKRKIETIQSVNFKSDSLVLTLYDNGEVDGDTVSVILNGKTIMPHEGLSTKAITKTIYITPEMGDSLQIIMYAENLGSIPPNTGLLILQDGDDRYEIRFAGDLQKNSAIILRRKKQ